MNKRAERVCLAGLLAVLCGGCNTLELFEEASPPVPLPACVSPGVTSPDPAARQRIVVAEVNGAVERRRRGAAWSQVRAGDELAEDEEVRTVGGTRVVLELGSAARVELSPGSGFSVKEISRSIARVKLSEGRLAAVLNGDSGALLRVEVEGSDAVAEAKDGDFSVLSQGDGRLSVAANTGRVRLSARDQTVEVFGGQQALVNPNEAPQAPAEIPSSLYLRVGTPASLLQRERQLAVTGRASPGAVVSVNGVNAQSDGAGEFTAVVPLREGTNSLVVHARDVSGRQQAVTLPPVIVKPPLAPASTTVRWAGTENAR
ncbi:MAG: hypothetical protein ACYC8T_21870 [Myxococcaceae bacterium]